jgi:ribonucleotide reductase beta subunit family protein with ferritin-like domain
MQCENHEFCTKFWGKCRNFCAELKIPFSDAPVKEIVDSAIHIEECFICEVLPFNLMGMNASLMSQYI